MSVGQYVTGSSGTFGTFGTLHGVMEAGDWNQPTQILSLPGVIGVSQLLDYRKFRELSMEFRIHGYATYALIETAINSIDSQNQTLTGSVVISGALVATFANCTFLGFKRGKIKYDGSGEHDWWVDGRLHWLQRAPN